MPHAVPMFRTKFWLVFLPALLSACGEDLGEYQLEGVRLVKAVPAAAVDDRRLPSRADYFRIALSSKTNLYAKNTGPGLYTDADFCPLRNSDRIVAFGPLNDRDEPVEDYKRAKDLTRGVDDRYHYVVYVLAKSPPRKLITNSEDVVPSYDLRKGERGLCLRFFVPGYNLTPSQSGTVEVPAEVLATAAPG